MDRSLKFGDWNVIFRGAIFKHWVYCGLKVLGNAYNIESDYRERQCWERVGLNDLFRHYMAHPKFLK